MQVEPKYSVVIPCYKSETSILELLERIVKQFEAIDETFEIICVDDASPDGVADIILDFHQRDPRIKLIRLFRNYGQHHALLTGFRYVEGEYVFTLDDDLQHPPEEIPRFIEAMGKNDVVLGVPEVKQHSTYKNLGSKLMRLILRIVFNPPPGFISSAYRLMRRPVADRLASTQTIYPYISGMILRLTRNVGNVNIRHDKRKYGKSGYSLMKAMTLASNLLINYSKIPLQIIIAVGLITFLLSAFAIISIMIKQLFIAEYSMGWPSLVIIISFFGSLNLLALSMIGEYILRLLNENSKDAYPVVRKTYLGDEP